VLFVDFVFVGYVGNASLSAFTTVTDNAFSARVFVELVLTDTLGGRSWPLRRYQYGGGGDAEGPVSEFRRPGHEAEAAPKYSGIERLYDSSNRFAEA
jgi:hypothetical protein